MTEHFTLQIDARSSLLIGGGATPDGVHGSHIADSKGRPYIPATALRGAMRETLEALLRGAGLSACEAGSGLLPGVTRAAGAVPHPCSLDGGHPCVACRLFGGARNGLAPGACEFSSLVVGDGVLTPSDDAAWTHRTGVSIARAHRSAAEDRLFVRRTTATGATFVAEGLLRDPALKSQLTAAVAATLHVGSGRSRGAARVDMTLQWKPAPAVTAAQLTAGDVRVRVTLLSPTILGVPLAHTNLRETRREIPGSALRGAVGFALAQVIPSANSDPDFLTLVNEQTGARFGFLWPVDATNVAVEPAGVLPLTTHHCKEHGVAHGDHDDLFDRIAVELIDRPEQVDPVHRALRASACKRCNGNNPLRAAHGYRRLSGTVPVRAATRASIERMPSSVRDGALFTEVSLDPGTVFEGHVRNLTPESRKLIAQCSTLPLSVGRARGAGCGRVKIELVDAPKRESVKVRAERFDAAWKKHLIASRLPLDTVGHLVPITLLSPCVIEGEGDEWRSIEATLPAALQGVTVIARARRFTREGTWDQSTGQMHPLEAVATGAVYVLRLPPGRAWPSVLDALDELERRGIGLRRHQGFGDVFTFDPIHVR